MPNYKSILVLGMILFGSGCAYYNTLFNAKDNYNEGLKILRESPEQTTIPANARKSFETTIDKCWKLIDIYSDKSKYADDALLLIAKSEFHIEKYIQSKQHLDQFMRKYSESDLFPEANLWYGKILLYEKDIDGANEYFRRVINNGKDAQIRSQASFELGKYAFQQKDYPKAIEYLQTALKEDLSDEYKAEVMYSLAEAHYQQGDLKNAVSQYEKVEKQNPTLDIEYRSKMQHSRALVKMDKSTKALEILRKMITAPRFKPFLTSIKTEIGGIYEKQDDLITAVETYNEVISEKRSDVGTAWAAYHLAQLYETELNNLDSAVFYYKKTNQVYSKFDSAEVALRKEKYLGEFKEIVDNIDRDELLVTRLTTEPDFLDSLYEAQYEDSFRIANGLGIEDTTAFDSLLAIQQMDSVATDSSLFSSIDSQTKLFNQSVDTLNPNIPQDTDPLAAGTTKINSGLPPNPIPAAAGKNNKNVKPKKKLEKRKLPQIEFDLMNSRYQLAEFYLLKEENYDSAAYYFDDFIHTYEDSILTPKAYYSLIYINRSPQVNNMQKVYEYEKELLANYIDSPFAIEIMKNRGMYEEEEKAISAEEMAYQKFLAAESLYFAGQYRPAIEAYEKIADLDTSWNISAKAQFAVAWVYERDLGMRDSAFTAYERIIQRFPQATDFVRVARKKISPPVEKVELTDSTAIAGETAIGDTGEEVLAENTGSENNAGDTALRSEDILREKIRWRNQRESR